MRGFTIVETLIAAGLMAVLVVALFAGWSRSAQAMDVAQERSQMVSQAQILFRQLDQALENSTADSVEITDAPSALSFVSAYGVRGTSEAQTFEVRNDGTVRYQRYSVLYLDESERTLRLKELAIPNGSPVQTSPGKLSTVDLGSGAQPLLSYLVGGRSAAKDVNAFSSELKGRVLTLVCELQTKDRAPGKYHLSVLLRN
jgi:type II secretory pathway pseudopilin PulG